MSTLSANTLALLVGQYAHEKRNQLIYEAMASTADFQGMTGTAAFFRKEAEGEGGHAKAVFEFINSRNEHAKADMIQTPETPEDFFELFDAAMEIEIDTTEKLKSIAKSAMSEGDLQTFYWIADLIKEQTEEENLYRTILDRFASCGSDPAMIHHFDLWIGGL